MRLAESTYHSFIGGSTEVERNIISGNNGSGVALEGLGVRYNFVMGNNVGTDVSGIIALPNQAGIDLKGGEYNFVQENIIAYNVSSGVAIRSGAWNSTHHNHLTENSPNSFDKGKNNRWDDGSQGNYWGDYTGKDSNDDGIGDTPYQVPPDGIDNYPLMKP